jgi:hypothetical protein
MHWRFIEALMLAVPIVLLPVAIVWYFNLGGLGAGFRHSKAKKMAHRGVNLK